MGMKQGIPDLGPLEFRLLRILWRRSPATAREVLDRLNARSDRALAYTTVMTLLGRLVDKGVLDVDRARQPFRFRPLLTRDQVLRQRLSEFVDQFFDGRVGDLAVRLVEDEPLSEEAIAHLEDLLARHRTHPEDASAGGNVTGPSAGGSRSSSNVSDRGEATP